MPARFAKGSRPLETNAQNLSRPDIVRPYFPPFQEVEDGRIVLTFGILSTADVRQIRHRACGIKESVFKCRACRKSIARAGDDWADGVGGGMPNSIFEQLDTGAHGRPLTGSNPPAEPRTGGWTAAVVGSRVAVRSSRGVLRRGRRRSDKLWFRPSRTCSSRHAGNDAVAHGGFISYSPDLGTPVRPPCDPHSVSPR